MTDFWETFSWQFYLLSHILSEICCGEIAEEIYFFSYFVLKPVLGYDSRLLRLISQHTTYYTTAITKFDYEILNWFVN